MPDQLYFAVFDTMHLGDGRHVLVPRKPKDEMTTKEAARFLRRSRQSVHVLINCGFIETAGRTPGRVTLVAESVIKFKEASNDEEWWTPARRALYSQGWKKRTTESKTEEPQKGKKKK